MNRRDSRIRQINRVTMVGFFVNLLLTVGKILAGIAGRSGAMIADGVHSLSDFITDIIVLVFIRTSGKGKDSDHPYGHGKFETFATMLISFMLMLVAAGILWAGFQKILHVLNGETIGQPGLIALAAALVSVLCKELLYWYTLKVGRKTDSQAVVANAWHHRSDALSSIGTALGISGAIYLGENWRVLDPIAGIIVSFFIIRVAWKLARPSVKELLENSLSNEVEEEIASIILHVSGVKDYHNLRTRKIGNTVAIDAHVKVDKDITVEESHDIASAIERELWEKYGADAHIGIHIEPYYA